MGGEMGGEGGGEGWGGGGGHASSSSCCCGVKRLGERSRCPLILPSRILLGLGVFNRHHLAHQGGPRQSDSLR